LSVRQSALLLLGRYLIREAVINKSMYYYLYKITNLLNNKFYIGIHSTENLEDGYFGSGRALKQAISKHGKHNFKKEILEYFNSYEEVSAREKEIVNEEFVKSQKTYNLNIGGYGSFSYINSLPNQGHRPGQQKEAAKIAADKLKFDQEHRAKFCAKMRDARIKQIQEGKMCWQQPDYINPAKSRKWISHDTEACSMYIEVSDAKEYLEQGWYYGRKYNPYNTNRSLYKKRI
jgi:hypothetical protein